jgi:hypothetical protein
MCKGGGSGTKYVKLKRHHPRVHVKDYKNYIPPGGRSPWKNEGGPIPIKQVLLQCSKNRGGGGMMKT